MTADPEVTDRAGDAPPAPPPRWSRVRIVVFLLTTLLGTGLLLWGADRLGRSVAESVIADEVQRVTGTFTPPEVEVHGASFLLQAVSGRYEQVDIAMRGLSSGPLTIERLDAELTGVRLSFHDLILGNADRIVVERAAEEALLGFDDLNYYLRLTGRPVEVRPTDEPDEVQLTGTVQVFDRSYTATVDAQLGAEGGALAVTPTRVDPALPIDAPGELLLGERFTFLVPLDPLPFGQRVVDLAVEPDGIVVHATGDFVVLRPR